MRVLARLLLAALIGGLVSAGRAQDLPPRAPDPSLNSRDITSSRNCSCDSGRPASRVPLASTAVGGPIAGTSVSKSRILLGFYCALIVGASLLGGWLPRRVQLSHTRMQVIISVIAGLMLAIGVFHMLPHALAELGDDGPDKAATGMMVGLVAMFLILRMFASHQHSADPSSLQSGPTGNGHDHYDPTHGGKEHDAAHAHSSCSGRQAHSLSWVGVCLGMGLHTLIDGLALGASVESDALEGGAGLFGLGTFLAVLLHKPIDSMSITSLMAITGWSSRSQSLANSAFSLICPLGAGLFVLGLHEFSGSQSTIVGWALAASAGVFVCIALTDLLPELEFHSHDRIRLTIALIGGIVLGWAIHLIDPAHEHSHSHAQSVDAISNRRGNAATRLCRLRIANFSNADGHRLKRLSHADPIAALALGTIEGLVGRFQEVGALRVCGARKARPIA